MMATLKTQWWRFTVCWLFVRWVDPRSDDRLYQKGIALSCQNTVLVQVLDLDFYSLVRYSKSMAFHHVQMTDCIYVWMTPYSWAPRIYCFHWYNLRISDVVSVKIVHFQWHSAVLHMRRLTNPSKKDFSGLLKFPCVIVTKIITFEKASTSVFFLFKVPTEDWDDVRLFAVPLTLQHWLRREYMLDLKFLANIRSRDLGGCFNRQYIELTFKQRI